MQVATLKKSGQDASAKIAELVALDTRLNELEAQLKQLEADREANLNKIANILDPSVPVSKDEADNAVVFKHGELRREEGLYHHHELLWMIDGYEPEVRASFRSRYAAVLCSC